MRKTIILCTYLFSTTLFSQSFQSEYLEAKRLFNEEQYASARGAFSTLMQGDNPFQIYSEFYYAVSAYRMGDVKVAVDKWQEMLLEYPLWKQRSEILLWLAYAQFEGEKYNQGLSYINRFSEETRSTGQEEELLSKYIYPLPWERIQSLQRNIPEDKELAEVLIRKLSSMPQAGRNLSLLDSLMSEWGFEPQDVVENLPKVMKKEYHVAVLLPFMFDSFENPGRTLQNALVVELYQGMQMAAKELKSSGVNVVLHPYDTKKSEDVTHSFLSQPGFKEFDLIVGPLFPGPFNAVMTFSRENKINMINPLSVNSKVIEGNPFSFLYKPANETQARALAALASREEENRNLMIFYEQNDRDSVFAMIYKKYMEEAGYTTILTQPIEKENSQDIYAALTGTYEVYLTREKADSISQLPGRFIKEKTARPEDLNNDNLDYIITEDERGRKVILYENRLYMKPDSIGHFLVATRNNSFGQTLIGAVENRGDSIRIYTYGDWLDFTMVSFQQLERLGVAMAYPEFVDKDRYSYPAIEDKFLQRYRSLPSAHHLLGYELLLFVGHRMEHFGKYFQNGLRTDNYYQGKVYEGFRYGMANDNQVVPVVRFKQFELEPVNRARYEDRKE